MKSWPPFAALSSLPPRHLLAFAGRCARRVLPLLKADWQDAPTVLVEAFEEGVRRVELAAGGHSPRVVPTGQPGAHDKETDYDPARSHVRVSIHSEVPEVAIHQECWAAIAVMEAVSNAAFMTLPKERPIPHRTHEVMLATIRSGFMWSDVVGVAVVSGIGRDFQSLDRGLRSGYPPDSPVVPSDFGPLWPDGVPAGWPQGEDSGSVAGTTPLPLNEILTRLQRRNDDIDKAHSPIIGQFEKDVAAVEGANYGSLEANQRVADAIQETADKLQVLFKCSKCGTPARFRCTTSQKMPTGAFVFKHSRHTHGGTSEIPPLEIVPAPADGRKTKKREEVEEPT